MEPAIVVAVLWGIFGGTHVLLATRRLRAALVAGLGEGGFLTLYSLVAALTYAALVVYYAAHRLEGVPGPGLAAVPAARAVLLVASVLGVMLMTAALAAYPRMPMALFGQPMRVPRGIEAVTRHPFFVGVALFAVAHTLLATRLVGAVFTAGFAVLALAGARHQDQKLLERRGPRYGDYLAATSTLPFAAILAGRQRLVWRELPFGALALGLAIALGLRAAHDGLFAHGGLWMIVGLLGGAGVATLQSWRRARRVRGTGALAPERSYSG